MLKSRVSLKDVFRYSFLENEEASEEIDLICVLDNPKLIL